MALATEVDGLLTRRGIVVILDRVVNCCTVRQRTPWRCTVQKHYSDGRRRLLGLGRFGGRGSGDDVHTAAAAVGWPLLRVTPRSALVNGRDVESR